MISKQPLKITVFFALFLLLKQCAFAQNKVVTGKITESNDGSVLSNVSVIANGTQIGTQTDSNGYFRLTIPTAVKTLTISAIGFLSQDIDVRVKNTVSVKLVATASSLNEVVVVGYGTLQRK